MGSPLSVFAAIAAGGNIFSGIGSYIEGQQQSKAYRQQAEAIATSRHSQAMLEISKRDRLLALQRVQAAASGIEFQGSPVDVQASTEYEFAQEMLAQNYNALLAEEQAGTKARQASFAGTLGLFNGLFNAGANVASANYLANESKLNLTNPSSAAPTYKWTD